MAKKSDDSVIYNETVSFKTKDVATAIDQMSNDPMRKCENEKILRNGQLFILRGDKVYTVTGQEVK